MGPGRKLIPAGSTARMLADGFRDGRHELSPLCPGACGARPRLVGDSIRLRRGHLRGHRQKARPERACRFRDGPARDPGKSPRAGCLGHHHQTFKSDTMSAVHPAPLSSLQGASPWRVSCWVPSPDIAFPGFIPGSGGVSDAGSTRPRHEAGGSGERVGKLEQARKRSAAARTQLSRVARTSARRMSIGARPCLVRTCQ